MDEQNSMDNIENAIAKAKARRNAKAQVKGVEVSEGTEAQAPVAPKASGRKRLTDEERQARLDKLTAERQVRKEARLAKREARQAELAAQRAGRIPHLGKVSKALGKLPALDAKAQALFGEATAGLSLTQIQALGLHLGGFYRTRATVNAVGVKLSVGQEVLINGGEPRFIGKQGTVVKVQRIRCYVEVPGASKPVYLFTSDVVPVMSDSGEATGTEG